MAIYEDWPYFYPVPCSQQSDTLLRAHPVLYFLTFRRKQTASKHVGTFVQAGLPEEAFFLLAPSDHQYIVKAQDTVHKDFHIAAIHVLVLLLA